MINITIVINLRLHRTCSPGTGIPDICHKYHKWDMWRKICHVETFRIYMHDRCEEIWNFSTCWVISIFFTLQMWSNLKFLHIWHANNVENVFKYVHIVLFCWKIGFAVIYAVLSWILLCRNLRTFVWRKIEPKIMYVEEKWQIWGMGGGSTLTIEVTVKYPCFFMPSLFDNLRARDTSKNVKLKGMSHLL